MHLPTFLHAMLSTPRIRILRSGLAVAAWIAVVGCAAGGGAEDPLAGAWELNLNRTRYGSGADPRKQETFICRPAADAVRCTIRSVRFDGQRVSGGFTARYDGTIGRVHGIPGIDEVRLRRTGDLSVDATFGLAGKPVFGYRAIRSAEGTSLTIMAVDPLTRARLASVAAYDRVR